MQRRYRTQYWKGLPSDNPIRRWLKQFQKTGSVLRRKGAGRPSTWKEDVDRVQKAFSLSSQKSTRQAYLQLGIPETTVWRVVHKRLHLHVYKVQIV
jgi:transposase